ncbi:type II toxin-antitoxin system RelE/ParE family toxin [Shewanella sp. 202IG2-18]|uniref:type II toxin-antitoxin system RelE/ParE family toxin n=1 Tax=Parashewanella hymeniacidonis TaxID=2807618 RepID=UPI001960A76A|nr:type II toxin-antitoxin system RelE/ParE family toxin [Parashewanella hymeniacidonis]
MFDDRFLSLDTSDQINVRASLGLLVAKSAQLELPHADSLNGSKHRNMKELRVQSNGKPLRVFFAFDPQRTGIILCTGDKTGDKRFYKKMIPIADSEYEHHLEEL